MSRSGYTDDYDGDDLMMGRWRGMVASATRGKRGQKLLSDLLAALDAMHEKALIVDDLKNQDGDVCALGALALARNMDIEKIDPKDPDAVAAAFDIAPCLAQEIAYMNDEYFDSYTETPEERWAGMRNWISGLVKSLPAPSTTPSSMPPS